MSADLLLSKLEKVRQTGPGTWKALCPSHDDRSPSLSIREAEDGRILLRCFAECSFHEIVAAIGMDISDPSLYPPRPIPDRTGEHKGGRYRTRVYRPFDPGTVLECLANETRIAALCSGMLQDGCTLSPEVHDRLILAADRIEEGCELAHGRYPGGSDAERYQARQWEREAVEA